MKVILILMSIFFLFGCSDESTAPEDASVDVILEAGVDASAVDMGVVDSLSDVFLVDSPMDSIIGEGASDLLLDTVEDTLFIDSSQE